MNSLLKGKNRAALLFFALVLILALPMLSVWAQESTEDPVSTDAPVQTATEAPPVETEIVAETPEETVTDSEEVTEETSPVTVDDLPTEISTETPTQAPTPPAEITLFEEDFQEASLEQWLTSLGWQIASAGDNLFLSASTPNETAAILNLDWAHLLFGVKMRVDEDSLAYVSVRTGAESYKIALNAYGGVALYRGETLLGEYTPVVDESEAPFEPVWRTLNIQALGDSVIVAVDGITHITYIDPAPLGAGLIVFSTGTENTGTVSIDDIVIHKLEPIIPVVTPEPTALPTETPEVVETTDAPESSETAVPETEEAVENVTTLPDSVGTLVLSSDFQVGTDGWLLSENASRLMLTETNGVLLLEPNSRLVPQETLFLTDFRMDALVNLAGTESGSSLNILFRSLEGRAYLLNFAADYTQLYLSENDVVSGLASSRSQNAADNWHKVSISVQGSHILVAVDGVIQIDVTDESLSHGQIAFFTGESGRVMLDDITIIDTTVVETITPTATPLGINESNAYKLDGALLNILNLYLDGDREAAVQLAQEAQIPVVDDALRIGVVVWAALGQTGESIAPTVETAGGIVQDVMAYKVKALVPLASFVALVNTAEIEAVWLQNVVATNSPFPSESQSPSSAPAGSIFTEGFDIIGANPWHAAGITGSSAASIAVLDIQFDGLSALNASERACVSGQIPSDDPGINSDHGTRVVQILCDIAPAGGTVNLYKVAQDGSDLASKIAIAQANNKIILITLDLGAHVSPGDGTGGGFVEDFQIVYDTIAAARQNGRIVIASAGNNEGRYRSYNTSGVVNFSGMSIGDRVNVSWNSWGGTTFPTMTLSGGNGSYTSRPANSPAGFQFTVTSGTGNLSLTITNPGLIVQVQVVDMTNNGQDAVISGGMAHLTTTGNIARPADSPNVIAVGAVCIDREGNYPILANSSRGPIFNPGGGNPGVPPAFYRRDQVKPDLVGPSQVSIVNDEVSSPDLCNQGFGGSSAAAAHVAGMVALMVANPNSSMDAFDSSNASAFEAVKNYLQTRAIDMPFGAAANGFDTTFGAGLAVLGDPNFDLTTAINYLDPVDNIDINTCSGGANALFVGQGNPGDPAMDGSQAHPFVSIAYALRVAPADSCVIVMPGEYGTPLYVNNLPNNNITLISYDQAVFASVGNSTFWTNNVYLDISAGGAGLSGGVYIRNALNFTLDGFIFNSSSFFDPLSPFAQLPRAILVDGGAPGGSVNTTIRNNTINNFDFGRPVQVVNGAQNVRVQFNNFQNNDSPNDQSAALSVRNSGTTTPIVIENNTFFNNTSIANANINLWQAIVDTDESVVDIQSNVFNANRAETIVRAKASTNPTRELRILGNVFLKNVIQTGEIASNTGPLINVRGVQRFYFVNNTVVNNTLPAGTYSALLGRGNNLFSGGAPTEAGAGFGWEIRSNIIYGNIISEGIAKDFSGGLTGCQDFADGSFTNDRGAQRNWIFDNVTSFGFGGECNTAIGLGINNNVTTVDISRRFIGKQPGSLVTDSSPIYYALTDPTVASVPALPAIPDNQDGIDDGDDAFYTAFLAGAGKFQFDAAGKARHTDGDNDGNVRIDVGAYELVVLNIIQNPIVANFNEDGIPGGGVPFNIAMGGAVEGGYGELRFTVFQNPLRFGTHCSPLFANTSGAVVIGSDIMSYCPPKDFYTSGAFPGIVPNVVSFQYRVTDEVGATDTGFINITINPRNDSALTNVIGNNNPAGDVFEVVANANTLIKFRLRPFVAFGAIGGPLNGNMVFSERFNSLEPALQTQVDYPYTYSNLTLDTSDNPALFAGISLNPNTGVVTLNLENNQNKGTAEFTYSVTDVNGNTTHLNRVKIRVVSIIPNRGLHDDSSLIFTYNGAWNALYSEPNINNTLHQSTKAGDFAEFQFVGEGFVLYMQGDSGGGLWGLQVNGAAPGNWTPGPQAGESIATFSGITCSTRTGTSNTPNPGRLSNVGKSPYTVSCSGLTGGNVHTVRITNADNRRLNIDAFSIVTDDTNPTFGVGMHTIEELEQRQMFDAVGNWVELANGNANGGRARFTTSTAADLQFTIAGGTGFAIGTATEDADRNGTGAKYTICVNETTAPANATCQDFDNGVATSTGLTFKVFRPFYGLNPNSTYNVTLNITDIPPGERMFIDSIRVFNDVVSGPLPLGITEDDERDQILFLNSLDDSWVYDTNAKGVSNGSLTSLNKVNAAGPFITFTLPNTATGFIWYRPPSNKDSQMVMICVDRGEGASGNMGNCILVDLRTGLFRQQNPAGGFGLPSANTILLTNGGLNISESMFPSAWSGSEHVVEIFSLRNEPFNLDRVEVFTEDDATPLKAGYYEEYSLRYFTENAGVFTLQPFGSDGNFTDLLDKNASSGAVKQLLAPDGLNEGAVFQFTGTGFTVFFTNDNRADAVKICWKQGTIASLGAGMIADVLDEPSCQIFDNYSSKAVARAGRTILGLHRANYTVVVQMLDDNFLPITHDQSKEVPITMKIDSVAIYDDEWFTTGPAPWADNTFLNMLVPGGRYETSFVNRVADKNFLYYGSGWVSVSGSKAKDQSGQNFDQIKGLVGAGVLFRTNGADAMLLYRDTGKGNTPLQVCASPVNIVTDTVDFANRYCTTVYNDGNKGAQQPAGVLFNTTGNITQYVVSITTLDNGGVFTLDAIELLNSDTFDGLLTSSFRVLGAGTYEDYHPGLIYDRSFQSLIVNGDMERNADWTSLGATTGQSTGQKLTGKASWQVPTTGTTNAGGQGIQSTPFTVQAGRMYTVIARVLITSGTGTVTLQSANTNFGPVTSLNTPALINKWQTLRADFTAGSTNTDTLSLVSSGSGIVQFFVDDVALHTGGMWMPIFDKKFTGGTAMESRTHGAQMTFSFRGTGFEIGTSPDNDGGEFEVCYNTGAPFNPTGAQCFIYQNESKNKSNTAYTVAGLADALYSVRVRDLEDGATVLNATVPTSRPARNLIGKLKIDYVTIYNAALPTVIPAGLYNDNASDGSRPYLQLLPFNRWTTFTDKSAAKFSGQSYTTIVDNNGKAAKDFAGPVGVLRVNQNATVILYTDKAANNNSSQLLVCANAVNGALNWTGVTTTLTGSTNCTLLDAFRTAKQVVINRNNLPVLANAGPHTLTFRTLTASPLLIDHYQVIYGTTLTEGYYEDFVGHGAAPNILQVLNGTWAVVPNSKYSGGSALESTSDNAEIRFTFTGTGFSLVTLFDKASTSPTSFGGTNLEITIDGTTYDAVENVSTIHASQVFGGAVTFAGLPNQTYTVTIRNTPPNANGTRVVIDAIQIYGVLGQLGSIYDDAQLDAGGEALLTYGPENNSWLFEAGKKAKGYLNETFHQTKNFGASVSFVVGDGANVIEGLGVFTGTKSKALIDICWIRLQPTLSAQVCTVNIPTLSVNSSDRLFSDIPVGIAGGTQYAVSILNRSHNTDLFIDAVQVVEDGPLAEGVYNRDYLTTAGLFNGAWTDSGMLLKSGSFGASLDFEFRGTGFSIVLNESSKTSTTYELCVDTGAGGTGGGTQCNTIGATATTPLVLNRSNAASGKAFALTFTGMHGPGNTNAIYSVRLRNIDGVQPLLVERVEILGADPSLLINDFNRYENDAPQLTYFPFGSLVNVEAKSGPSGLSQHIGTLRGAVIYFEFSGHGFEYYRQLASSNGNVQICYGRIDNTGATTCLPDQSNVGNAFQRKVQVDTSAAGCDDADGCWVSIKALDDKNMPVDFIRLFDPNAPLTAGFYEIEGNAAVKYFDNTAGHPLAGSSFADLLDSKASGGMVRRTMEIGEGILFNFTGTGFTVFFTADSKADQVKICWKKNITNDVDDVLDEPSCQLFDNYSSKVVNTFGRTILGLERSDYTVVVQMLDENFLPVTHKASEMPLEMKLDALEIHDDQWFTPGSWNNNANLGLLTTGTRYEPSFVNREIDNLFKYYGQTWSSVTGGKANKYSGMNYDTLKGFAGAAVLFRTDGADGLIIYRDTKKDYAPLLVCAAPMNGAVTQVNLANLYCTTLFNDGGTSTSQPVGMLFNTTGDDGPHVVFMTTLTGGSLFLDALELVNSDTFDGVENGTTYRVLNAGLYEDSHPGLVFDRVFDSLIVNGDMERNSDWANIPGNAPTTNAQVSNQRYTGSFSRRVIANGNNRGIQSQPFDLISGQSYTFVARIYLVNGVAAMTTSSGNFTVQTNLNSALINRWQTVRVNYTAVGNETINLRFIASGGPAEFYVDDVAVYRGSKWTQIFDKNFSGGSAMESQTHGGQLNFTFTGTGFEIGTMPNQDTGGEVEVCYNTGAVFNPTGAKCFTYQNEAKTKSPISFTTGGLTNGTYSVRVRDVEDGFVATSKNPLETRTAKKAVAKLRIDFVRIFGSADVPPTVPAGFYNENAADNTGSRYLALLPANKWNDFSGKDASKYSSQTFSGVIASNGKLSKDFAGAAALMRVNVPAGTSLTVILYTGAATKNNSGLVLICADHVTGKLTWDGVAAGLTGTNDCVVSSSMVTTNQIVVTGTQLPALATTGTHTLSFRPLTPGEFKIDNFQIIEGSTLAAGIYDEFLPDNILDFTPNINPDPKTCNPLTQWCYAKSSKAYGGGIVRTQRQNATLVFNIQGTGFAVLSEVNGNGVDMRICYKLTSSSNPFPNLGDEEPPTEAVVGDNEVWCEYVTTDTGAAWNTLNAGRINPKSGSQYGFAYYGLPFGQYTVEVRVADTTIGARQSLQLDAVVVFGSVINEGTLLTSGLYDDADADVLYGPEPLWTTTTYKTGPLKGAWKLSEHITTNAGSIVQMYIEGNALTLYQTVSSKGSKDVRICLIITDDIIHCSIYGEARKTNQLANFSQNGKTTYFTPIVFYGLGDGTHVVIFENREHGRILSIDAIRPWE